MDSHKSDLESSKATTPTPNASSRGSTSQEPPTVAAIQTWLVSRLVEQMGIAPQETDVRAPFDSYGLDSVVMVGLGGEIEDWLGCRFSPTLLYEYSTIETLAQYLADEAKASC
jgi:acyl carrier protein